MQATPWQPHPAPSLPSTDPVTAAAPPRQTHHQQQSDTTLPEGLEPSLPRFTPEDSTSGGGTTIAENGTQQQSSRPQSGAVVAESAPEQRGQLAPPDTVTTEAGRVDPEPQCCQPFVDSDVHGSCFPQQAQLPCEQSGMPCGLGQLPTAQGELPFEQAGVPSEHRPLPTEQGKLSNVQLQHQLPTEQLCTDTQAAHMLHTVGIASSYAAQPSMHPPHELPSKVPPDNQSSDLQDGGRISDQPAELSIALGKAASDQDGSKRGSPHEGEGASGCHTECAADNGRHNVEDSTASGRAGLCPVGITTYTQVCLTLVTDPVAVYRASPQRSDWPLRREQIEKVSGFI